MTFSILPRAQALPYKPSVDGEDTFMYTVVCWMHDIYTLSGNIAVCVDTPIMLYDHTVSTHRRETCERKAMNQ